VASECLWKKGAGRWPVEAFPQVRNGCGQLSTGTRSQSGGGQRYGRRPAEQPVPETRAGYHSPVRSNTGDEIDRIATAIDQLESDARSGVGEAELTTRIASLWQMVSALDPELARRAQRYTAPPGATPSA
jgi:hypothetical protein